MDAEEQHHHCCKYCNTKFLCTSEYIMHQLQPPHTRRIKAALLQCGFSAMCLVCMSSLKDLKDVENHVSAQNHTDKYASHLSNTHITSSRYTCSMCGVAFYNNIAFEAHLLMPSHGNATNVQSVYELPNLNELLKQLSGLPGEHFAPELSDVCVPCNLPLDSFDQLILHMFTSPHISRLKLSKCIVCTKYFSHPVNCNDHLAASKHHSALQRCSNLLEAWRNGDQSIKGGYSCMYCMLWYSSWHGMELHLYSTQHRRALLQSEARHCDLKLVKFAFTSSAGDRQGELCDASAHRNWREWREDMLRQQAWCYRCGISVSTLDLASRHLMEHETNSTLESKHGCSWIAHKTKASEVLYLSPSLETFDCCVCALSFKSALMLSAHEACFEHHRRLELNPPPLELLCCSTCGVVCKQTDHEKAGCGNCRDAQQPLDDAGPQLTFLHKGKAGDKQDLQPLLVNERFKNVVRFNLPNAVVVNMPVKAQQGVPMTANDKSDPAVHWPSGGTNTAGGQSSHALQDPAEASGHQNALNRVTKCTNITPPTIKGSTCSKNGTTTSCSSNGDAHGAGTSQHDEVCLFDEGNSLPKKECHATELGKAPTMLNIHGAENMNNDGRGLAKNLLEAETSAFHTNYVQSSAIQISGTQFQTPVFIAEAIASVHTLSEAVDTMMEKVSKALLGAFPMYVPRPLQISSSKQGSAEVKIIKQHEAKRICDFHRSPHSSVYPASTSIVHEALQTFHGKDGNQTKAVLQTPEMCPPQRLGASADHEDDQLVLETQTGSAIQALNFSGDQPQELSVEQDFRSSCEGLQSQSTGMVSNEAKLQVASMSAASGHDEKDINDEHCHIFNELKDTSDWWRLISDLEDSSDSEKQV